MPPRCLHMSTLLGSVLADNSAGANLDEPVSTLKHRLETFNVNLAHSFAKHHDVISTDLNSSRSSSFQMCQMSRFSLLAGLLGSMIAKKSSSRQCVEIFGAGWLRFLTKEKQKCEL